jgi:hypothetical protein
MGNEITRVISTAIVRLLRPLVRILLRNNIPFGTFADLARWTYVDVASQEFNIHGKKQTTSRVSVLTGLSRKEVKRIKEFFTADDLGMIERYNRAARVISGWIKDERFLDENGNPGELPFEEGENSFSALVKKYSGDIPARAILDEMIRTDVVEKHNNKIRLLTRGYIVKRGDAEMLNILGIDVSELIETINHNIVNEPYDAFLQRKTSYDNIPEESLSELRGIVSKMGKEFIESVDKVISQYDRDVNPSLEGTGRKKAGLGVFYFE